MDRVALGAIQNSLRRDFFCQAPRAVMAGGVFLPRYDEPIFSSETACRFTEQEQLDSKSRLDPTATFHIA
jgi:hypothetical protein